ncbi:vWA domain-containing protein [Candidatus Poriferisocius sp.]|uniref:vWA domain-containing protein n=1 Tax=Candidatus Poriferisocius sp. TaxID=3101276 RepID=UPI003B020906
MDRSKSLETEDPQGEERRKALQATRKQLTELQERLSQDGSSFDIDVSLVVFSAEPNPPKVVAEFGPVSSNHPSNTKIEEALKTEVHTDYGPAIELALEQFKKSQDRNPDPACRILVFFTDGIMDPFGTVVGENSGDKTKEAEAEKRVSDFLSNLCSSSTNGYRYHMDQLGVSTYVAVLAKSGFIQRAGDPHQNELLDASKQSFLALTGHDSSPLLDGISAASGCESWSENQAGKVIDFDNISKLTDELEDAIRKIELGLRGPHVSCATEPSSNEVELTDEWPHHLRVTDQSGKKLCEVTPPRDGFATLTLTGMNEASGVEWFIDNGTNPEPDFRLEAGDSAFSFDIVSRELPRDQAFGDFEATVEIKLLWTPGPQPEWPDQPPEVPQPLEVTFYAPDREKYWIDKSFDCVSSQRARRTTGSNYKVVASRLCEIEPPPARAGNYVITFQPSQENKLSWDTTRDGQTPSDDSIVLESSDDSIILGTSSKEPRTIIDGLPEQFTDDLTVILTWYEPGGEVLAKQPIKDISIRVLAGGEYSPEADCWDSIDVELEKQGLDIRAVARGVCTIFPPPEGKLEVHITEATQNLQWQLTREGEHEEGRKGLSLHVEPGGESFDIDAILDVVPVELLPLPANFNVKVTWSKQDTESDNIPEPQEVVVKIPDIPQPQELLKCNEDPKLINSSAEVPSGPLVVDTGCTLLPHPLAGPVTYSVKGDVDDIDWQMVEDIELVPDDDEHRIIIETTDPLANRRYDINSDFTITATWKSPSGNTTYEDQESGKITIALRARPDTPLALLVTLLLILAGLIIVWLILWLVGRRVSRPARPGQYRVAHQGIKAKVASGSRLELAGFDLAAAVADNKYPLSGRRSKLHAAGLEIRTTLRWWSPRDLLGGGRARAIPKDMGADSLLAVSPSSERSDCLPVSLDDGAVIVAIQRTPIGSKAGLSEHTGQIWILTRSGKGKGSTDQNARKNLDKVLVELRKALSESQSKFRGSPDAPAPNQPKG